MVRTAHGTDTKPRRAGDRRARWSDTHHGQNGRFATHVEQVADCRPDRQPACGARRGKAHGDRSVRTLRPTPAGRQPVAPHRERGGDAGADHRTRRRKPVRRTTNRNLSTSRDASRFEAGGTDRTPHQSECPTACRRPSPSSCCRGNSAAGVPTSYGVRLLGAGVGMNLRACADSTAIPRASESSGVRRARVRASRCPGSSPGCGCVVESADVRKGNP